ncbi:MAG: hypothetical protein QOJ50_1947 [Cryptosporangiaceae bacterium]|nr:hypothetical protein [Cryptosporangiaceae bacterium]
MLVVRSRGLARARYRVPVQPSSGSFVALLVVLTTGALVATVWSWGWSRLKLIRRVVSLAATQLMVVLCVVAAVNASQDFFVTWDDLVTGAGAGGGGDPDAAPVAAAPVTRAAAGAVSMTTPLLGSQLQPAVDAAEQVHKKHPGRGVMVATEIRGPRTAFSLPARLYLPAAYFDPQRPDRVFPVVEFLTGYYGGLDIFQRAFSGDRLLDKLIAAGTMPPSIVVIPEQNPSLPKDSECVDAVGGDQAETYLAQDVPDVVRNDLRVSRQRTRWALMGYSTGGFCAANIAIHHPERFSTVVSLSGYFHAVTDRTTGDLYRDDPAARLHNTPSHTITLPRTLPLNFYLATSTGDGEGMGGVKELAPLIVAPDRLTKVVGGKTGHNFGTWRKQLPAALTWLGAQFKAKPVGTPPSHNQGGDPAAPPPGATLLAGGVPSASAPPKDPAGTASGVEALSAPVTPPTAPSTTATPAGGGPLAELRPGSGAGTTASNGGALPGTARGSGAAPSADQSTGPAPGSSAVSQEANTALPALPQLSAPGAKPDPTQPGTAATGWPSAWSPLTGFAGDEGG